MQEFYKRTLVALILLLVADALVACFCIYQSYPSASLIPKERGAVHWRMLTTTDAEQGGTSSIRIVNLRRKLTHFAG